MPKPQIDLSFPRYVAARKGAADARAREGSAYAYGGDLKVRATLDRIRPVTLAVEATVREHIEATVPALRQWMTSGR